MRKISSILLISVLFTSASFAGMTMLKVQGVVDEVTTNNGLSFDSSVYVGMSINGFATWQEQEVKYGSSYQYIDVDEVSLTAGNYTFAHIEDSSQQPVLKRHYTDPIYRCYSRDAFFSGTIYKDEIPLTYQDSETFGVNVHVIDLLLLKEMGFLEALSDVNNFNTCRSFSARIYDNDGFVEIAGHLTAISVVPEPATLTLLGLGLFVLRRKFS